MKNKIVLIIGIILLIIFGIIVINPIQENCFGEGKDCNYLDEINIEHLFFLTLILIGIFIIYQLNKISGILKDTQDIIVTLENEQ